MEEKRSPIRTKIRIAIIGLLYLFTACSKHNKNVNCKQQAADKVLSDISTSSAMIVVNIKDKAGVYPLVISLNSLLNYFKWFERSKHDVALIKIRKSFVNQEVLTLSDSTLKYIKSNEINPGLNKYNKHNQSQLETMINNASPEDERYILYTLSEKFCQFYYRDDESGKLKLIIK